MKRPRGRARGSSRARARSGAGRTRSARAARRALADAGRRHGHPRPRRGGDAARRSTRSGPAGRRRRAARPARRRGQRRRHPGLVLALARPERERPPDRGHGAQGRVHRGAAAAIGLSRAGARRALRGASRRGALRDAFACVVRARARAAAGGRRAVPAAVPAGRARRALVARAGRSRAGRSRPRRWRARSWPPSAPGVLVIAQASRATPERFPRRPGMAAKRPLRAAAVRPIATVGSGRCRASTHSRTRRAASARRPPRSTSPRASRRPARACCCRLRPAGQRLERPRRARRLDAAGRRTTCCTAPRSRTSSSRRAVPNLDLAPAHPDLAAAAVELPGREDRDAVLGSALASLGDAYPYVILDCPPSLGLLTLNALAAANRLIVPVQCEYYALEGLAQLLESVERIRGALNPGLALTGLLLTMYDRRTRLSGDVEREVRTHFGPKVFASRRAALRAARRGAQPRPADHALRPALARRGRLLPPRAGGGRAWLARRRDAASGRGSRSCSASRRRGAHGVAARDPARPDRARTRASRARASTRSASPSSSSACAATASCSRCSCAASGSGYELIAGERRWRAAQAAGLATRAGARARGRRPHVAGAGAGREHRARRPRPGRAGARATRACRTSSGSRTPRSRRPSGAAARRSSTPCACSTCPTRCSS